MSILDNEQKLQDDLDREIVNKIGTKIYDEFILPNLIKSNDRHSRDIKRVLDGVIRYIAEENDSLRCQISRNEDLLSFLNGMYYGL